MENSSRAELIRHLTEFQNKLPNKFRDKNTNFTLLEQQVYEFLKIYQHHDRWQDVFDNQIGVIPKSLMLSVYQDALLSFLETVKQELVQTSDEQLTAKGIIPERLPELVRLLEEHRKKQLAVETTQQQWLGKWKVVFNKQARLQRLRALGILSSASEVIETYPQLKQNLVEFAEAVTTVVEIENLTPQPQPKSSHELTQNIVNKLRQQGVDLGLPEIVPTKIASLVEQIRLRQQITHLLEPITEPDQATINNIAVADRDKLNKYDINQQVLTITDYLTDRSIYAQTAVKNSLTVLAADNLTFQALSAQVNREIVELSNITSTADLTTKTPLLRILVSESVQHQIFKSIGGNLDSFRSQSVIRLNSFLFSQGITTFPSALLNQMYDQVIAAPSILPPETKGPPPPTAPTGMAPVVTKVITTASRQAPLLFNKIPLPPLKQALSSIFSRFGKIIGGIFSKILSVVGFGGEPTIGQLPTNVLSVPSTAGLALSNLLNTGRTVASAVKAGTGLLSSPANAFLAIIIAVFLSLVIDIAPLGASPTTTVIPIALTPAGGKGPAEYYEEIYYEGEAPPAEIAGCPVNEGYISQCPGGVGTSHENLEAYDFARNDEALVYATHDGYVVSYYNGMERNNNSKSGGFGNYVRLVGETADGERFYTTYAHFWRVSKLVIDAYACLQRQDYSCALIKTGDVLGQVDNTGYSSGPHLHYQYNGPGRLVLPDGCGGWPKTSC